MTFTVHCSKCGHGEIIASGFIASALPASILVASLNKLGWQSAPRILCRTCWCPLEYWQMKKAMEIADEFEVQSKLERLSLLESQLRIHYPGKEETIKKWFSKL